MNKVYLHQLLSQAGIIINGKNPYDIQVRDERFYNRVLSDGSLGLGESYMDGWWECARIDAMIARVLSADLHKQVRGNLPLLFNAVMARLINLQSPSRAFKIGEAHYDIGNDLYRAMLGKRIVYTCGYWRDARSLDEAQDAKLDLVCRKIGLKHGDSVLDIGCGWGSFAKFAAERYGASVVGITVSQQQAKAARELCTGLPIEVRLQDYREVHEKFDHIISLGMFEHVGYKNYRTYMKVVERCLKDDGLFLLHTIGSLTSSVTTDSWIAKYIFPNSMLPSAHHLTSATEGLFVMEDWHNFSADYDKTLLEWHKNFESHWETLRGQYNERFYRMWRYYLLTCAGSFRARRNQLWQIVYSKKGVQGGYTSLR